MGDEEQPAPHLAARLASSSRTFAWTVTSSAVVGLVGDDQPRVARQRHRDHHPLAQAAGQLVRVAAQARTWGSGMPVLVQQLASAPGRLDPAASATWAPTRIDGFSDPIGSWKTEP